MGEVRLGDFGGIDSVAAKGPSLLRGENVLEDFSIALVSIGSDEAVEPLLIGPEVIFHSASEVIHWLIYSTD